MFDISDMAKAAFDPILSTPLQIAQKGECNSTIGGEGKRQLSISPQKSMLKTINVPRKTHFIWSVALSFSLKPLFWYISLPAKESLFLSLV